MAPVLLLINLGKDTLLLCTHFIEIVVLSGGDRTIASGEALLEMLDERVIFFALLYDGRVWVEVFECQLFPFVSLNLGEALHSLEYNFVIFSVYNV